MAYYTTIYSVNADVKKPAVTTENFHTDIKPTNGRNIYFLYSSKLHLYTGHYKLLVNSSESQSYFNHRKYDVNEL